MARGKAIDYELITACDYMAKGELKLVRKLLKQGANPNFHEKDHNTALCYATMWGFQPVVEALLEAGADVNLAGSYGRTPLMYATGHYEIARLLLAGGAEVNATNDGGDNALMDLCGHGVGEPDTRVVELLLDHGLVLEYQNRDKTALSWACFCGKHAIVKVLLARGAGAGQQQKGEPPLARAFNANTGKREIIELFIDQGADVNTKDDNGTSVLMIAARDGYLDLVKKLVAKGANIHATDDSGNTALMRAADSGRVSVVKFLMKKGATTEVRRHGELRTALMEAAYSGHLKVVAHLIAAGADPRRQDHKGNSALMQAAWGRFDKVVQFLLEHGADVHERNKFHWTPLTQACERGSVDTVKVLLAHGAEVNIKENERGATPLMIAERGGHANVSHLLLAHGADAAMTDASGATAADYTKLGEEERAQAMEDWYEHMYR